MLSDYVASVQPNALQSLDPLEIASVDAQKLASLLSEWASRDVVLRRRLLTLMSDATHQLSEQANVPLSTEGNGSLSSYMVGSSQPMRRLFEAIRRYAVTNAPVLITGESGTGKELAARALHERSSFNRGPFVAINCGALPTTLIGSELFGYEKGAFTGATARKIGRIESAESGTIFLDEIGDLPLETQAHLLRFLQERTIERIGGCKPITINARVLAATNVNLPDAVAKGRFREDLFYRLNVLTLVMPPLRERGDDIALVTRFFLQRFASEMKRETLDFSLEAVRKITTYSWPGNVRELIACIRRAVVMADGSEITVRDLGLPDESREEAATDKGLEKARGQAEAGLIRAALERNRFNIKQSAEELGISRVTLYRLIQKHDIAINRSARRA
jgi:DNA-binding NtrC family response regulator